MKKTISLFAILVAAVSLNSCWIAPVYQDYETVGKTSYFKDYETMKAVTVANINKSFTDWHWSTKEFDKKMQKYKGNVYNNQDALDYMAEHSEYIWAVKNDSSLKDEKNENTIVKSEYFWITSVSGESVVFYKN